MKLPAPRDQLAGCLWLPRILAKARRLQDGTLPSEYAARFCHAGGVDGQFLSYFHLTREEIQTAAALSDTEAAAWFLSRYRPDIISGWNHIALNLGRPGFPLAERLPIALATTYKNVDPQGITTVFGAIEADERAGT